MVSLQHFCKEYTHFCKEYTHFLFTTNPFYAKHKRNSMDAAKSGLAQVEAAADQLDAMIACMNNRAEAAVSVHVDKCSQLLQSLTNQASLRKQAAARALARANKQVNDQVEDAVTTMEQYDAARRSRTAVEFDTSHLTTAPLLLLNATDVDVVFAQVAHENVDACTSELSFPTMFTPGQTLVAQAVFKDVRGDVCEWITTEDLELVSAQELLFTRFVQHGTAFQIEFAVVGGAACALVHVRVAGVKLQTFELQRGLCGLLTHTQPLPFSADAKYTTGVVDVSISFDGRWVAVLACNSKVHVYDTLTQKMESCIDTVIVPDTVRFTAQDTLFACDFESGYLVEYTLDGRLLCVMYLSREAQAASKVVPHDAAVFNFYLPQAVNQSWLLALHGDCVMVNYTWSFGSLVYRKPFEIDSPSRLSFLDFRIGFEDRLLQLTFTANGDQIMVYTTCGCVNLYDLKGVLVQAFSPVMLPFRFGINARVELTPYMEIVVFTFVTGSNVDSEVQVYNVKSKDVVPTTWRVNKRVMGVSRNAARLAVFTRENLLTFE